LIKSLDLENFVNLIGEIENDGVPIYMTACDVLAILSVTETFPHGFIGGFG